LHPSSDAKVPAKPKSKAPTTYREAGVDIDLEATAIKALIKNLTYRRKGGYMMAGSLVILPDLLISGRWPLR
jgi:phosphoribosylformylglycinamidine cyclo-ligase